MKLPGMLPHNHTGPVAENEVPLKAKVSFLMQPSAYPEKATKLEVKETHMSWVFLVNDLAYKLKKPVTNSLFDFQTLEARLQNCLEEVRVNKRLAADIYLGIVPLVINEVGKIQLDGKGQIVDWLVKMKRIPEENFLDLAIKSQKQDKVLIESAAHALTEFYRKAAPVETDLVRFNKKLKEEIVATHTGLMNPVYHFSPAVINEITNRLLQFLDSHYLLFDNRIANGKIIEAHGDLKPEHICLVPQPTIIDALEFCRELRIMDIAEELAFLDMECEMMGDIVTGQLFFDYYQKESADKITESLIFFYKSKKAFLRTYLVARHITESDYKDDTKWLFRANAYLQLAQKYANKLSPY
jgi:aminoglycoside phosphotransferase family enzyme